MTTSRVLALGGIAGPLAFTVAVIVGASLRPEYSHYAQFMSELGETDSRSEAVMNYVGFLPAGLLMAAAAVACWRRFADTWTGAAGSALVFAFAMGVFASGIFSCDTTCTPSTPSLDQTLHDVSGRVAFPSFVLAPLVLGLRFRRLEDWRGMAVYSFATSLVAAVAVVALVDSVAERAGTGLYQRIVVGSVYLWLAVVSWRLFTARD